MSGKYKSKGQIKDAYDVHSLGKGLQLKSKKPLQLTHAAAEKHLGLTEFKADRPLRDSHVSGLVKKMIQGVFHWEWVELISCQFGKTVYRMNGQHTCWTRLELPADYDAPCELLEYSARSDNDVRELYANIDRGAPHTRGNAMVAYLQGRDEFPDTPAWVIGALSSGFLLWHCGSSQLRKGLSPEDVAYLLLTEHYDAAAAVAQFLQGLMKSTSEKHMARSAVYAALFGTFAKSPQIAWKFWRKVADGVGVESRYELASQLRVALMQVGLAQASGQRSVKKSVTSEEMYRACIRAWNTHRSGQELRNIKFTASGAKRPAIKR